jgi:hypothetical protein
MSGGAIRMSRHCSGPNLEMDNIREIVFGVQVRRDASRSTRAYCNHDSSDDRSPSPAAGGLMGFSDWERVSAQADPWKHRQLLSPAAIELKFQARPPHGIIRIRDTTIVWKKVPWKLNLDFTNQINRAPKKYVSFLSFILLCTVMKGKIRGPVLESGIRT